jgi:putative endonuclease
MFSWFKKELSLVVSLGRRGEDEAQKHYKTLGYKIIAANEFNRKGKQLGEIDFIAQRKTEIAFVEVKTRTLGSSQFGSGLDAVNRNKQSRLLAATKLYLIKHPEFQKFRPHIDVCLVTYNLDKTLKDVIIMENLVEDLN